MTARTADTPQRRYYVPENVGLTTHLAKSRVAAWLNHSPFVEVGPLGVSLNGLWALFVMVIGAFMALLGLSAIMFAGQRTLMLAARLRG